MAVTSSFRAETRSERSAGIVTIKLVPIAWTPRGAVLGDAVQDVGIPAAGIFDWIDRTFPSDDERAFIASVRDVDLLARIQWESPFPSRLDERSVLNIEDLPDEIVDALTAERAELVACATCRLLCVRDEFVWKEKQLCAWDFHTAVFGKRGPWREGPLEARHLESALACAYVAPSLLEELAVDESVAVGALSPEATLAIVNAAIAADPARPHLAVTTALGLSLLRER